MIAMLPLAGRARVFGDDVTTETILPARRRRQTVDPVELRRYLFEEIDGRFASSVREGDILVAGRNFGGGSVTDLPMAAILCAGIRAVVAKTFTRNYLRGAFNAGLLAVCAATDDIIEGEPIGLGDGPEGCVELLTPRRSITCEPMAPFIRTLLEAGGLVSYLRAHGSFGPQLPAERL